MRGANQAKLEPFDASGWRIGIVRAQFNDHITSQLLEGVLARAKQYGLRSDNITIAEVAGAIEVPLVLQKLAVSGKYKALVAIACIIRGETPHFEYVSHYITEGILRVQLDNQIPIAFSVLTCDTEAQALARTKIGGAHLDAALHQARLLQSLS